MFCLLLTSCCFEVSQSTGDDDGSSFTKRSLCFVYHNRSTACVYEVEVVIMHQRHRQSANLIVKMRTWYLSFVPLISARSPKEFIFKSLKNSKESLFGSNIQIFEISTCVLPSYFSRLFNKYLSFNKCQKKVRTFQ